MFPSHDKTAASTACFAELWWVPSDMDQAEDRIHRIGQKENVQIYYPIAGGTIEEIMANRLIEKNKIVHNIIDGTTDEEFFQNQILDDILK